MAQKASSLLHQLIQKHQAAILDGWFQQQSASDIRTAGSEAALKAQLQETLTGIIDAVQSGDTNAESSSWENVRQILDGIARTRARQGFSPTQTATFVYSLKEPIFKVIREEFKNDSAALADQTWSISKVIDSLGLHTTEVFQRSREETIIRQQQELLELSTPVVKLWDDILALPLIGTLDSGRTQVVMESLLQEIVNTSASIAIIDITGVPTVDTLVAQHLLKTVAAARLMGADCIISGIRPQIAQTIVHLGVELNDVTTKATLADAFQIAMRRTGKMVVRMNGTQQKKQDSTHTSTEG